MAVQTSKISDLQQSEINSDTDFLEISRDNGDGSFSSFKAPAAAGGGGYMLGEIRYFTIDPGVEWLKLDGSAIDEIAYPELAISSFVKTYNAGSYQSSTTGAFQQTLIETVTLLDVQFIESSNEVIISPRICISGNQSYSFKIFDCNTEVQRTIEFTIDGVSPAGNLFIVTNTIEYKGDTIIIVYDDAQSSTIFGKIVGGVGGRSGVVDIQTISASPFSYNTSYAGNSMTGSSENGIIAFTDGSTSVGDSVFITTDDGLTFSEIDHSLISPDNDFAYIDTVRFYGNYLYAGSVLRVNDSNFCSIHKDDIVAIANGDIISYYSGSIVPGKNLARYADNGFCGDFANKTNKIMTGFGYRNGIGIADSNICINDIPKFYGHEAATPVPAGQGFFFTSALALEVSSYYVDEVQGIVSVGTASSGFTATAGRSAYSEASGKLFVFYGANDERILHYTRFDVTLSDVAKKHLPYFNKKNGAEAYVKAVV